MAGNVQQHVRYLNIYIDFVNLMRHEDEYINDCYEAGLRPPPTPQTG